MKYRLTRDVVILGVALALLSYEIVFKGARATALTALTGLLLSPLALRFDEARRSSKSPEDKEAPE